MIPLDAPNIGREEIEAVTRALESGFVSSAGPLVKEFERALAEYLGVDDAVALQSGTAALHLALLGLGIGPGDEVIVPVITFVASANAVRYVGATPVFVDVLPDTWTMDPAAVRRAITARTRAIMPVHLYGVPCHMDELISIAKEHGVAVVEDAAEALGARFNGTPAGCMGDIGCFSFNGNKIMTTGGGGALVARNGEVLERVRLLSVQAKEWRNGAFFHREVGFNYRMNNIAAAMGLAQLSKLESFLERKRRINVQYRNALSDCEEIRFQEPPEGAAPSWWMTAICLNGDEKGKVSQIEKKLEKKEIQTRRLFTPLVNMPPYQDDCGDFPVANELFEKVICLPSSTLLGDTDVQRTSQELKRALNR